MNRLFFNLAAFALRLFRRAQLPITGSLGRGIFQSLDRIRPEAGSLRRVGFQSLEKVAAAVLLLSAISAQAQFAIPWSRTAGGGAMNTTGGTFTAGSTSGQSDTGVSTGSTQRVVGGFWAIMDADLGPPQLITDGTVVSNLPDALVVSAEVVSHNATTYVWIEWGATTNFGNSGAYVNAGRKFSSVTVMPGFSGTLLPGGTYYFRLLASNSAGVVYGETQSFIQPLFVQTSVGLPAVSHGGMIWGDYDGDGLLDVFVHGETGTGRITQVWRNTGVGTFTNINAGLTPVSHGAAGWGDYNNDGRLDILLTGDTGTGLVAQVWRNTGSGFSNIVAGLPGVSNSAVAWADLDNDGRRDFALAGMTATGRVTSLWRNTGVGFSNIVHSIPGLDAAAVAAADYDNDGWTDFYVQGLTNSTAASTVGQFWRNVPGTMAFTNSTSTSVGRYFGTASWIDRDGNEFPDLLRNGFNASGNVNVSQTFTNGPTAFTAFGTPGVTLGYSGAAWCDYNADGWGDVVLWGQTASGTNTAQLWPKQPGVSATFTNSGFVMAGIAFGSGAWADYDNDGRPDLLMSGQVDGGARTSYLLRAMSPSNAAPTVPSGLGFEVASNGISLSWTASSDAVMAPGGISYNIRVGSSPGASDLFDPQANSTSGFRRVAELGNVHMGTNAFLAFTNRGIYFWSVQAIDNACIASAFAGERGFGIALPAFVTTQPPTLVDKSNAVFNASVNVSHTTAWFEYGTTTNYGSTSTAFSVGSIGGATNWSLNITNLQQATVYHVRAVGTNVLGRQNGSNITFQTRGPAVAFSFQTQPSSVATAGVNFVQQPVLHLVDALGAIDTGAVHSVTVSTASGTGTLLGTLAVNAVTGVVKFTNLSYTNAGEFTLAFSASGLTGTTSTPVTVNAAAANRFAVSVQPSAAVTAGVAFVSQPVLRVEDSFGNLVVTGNIPVSVGTATNSSVLLGITNTISTNGLAAFTGLNYTNAGTFLLRFTNSSLAVASITSTPVAVVASFATRLLMSNQPPANAIAGAAFSPSPVVRLEDAFGNVSLTSAVTVVAAVASGPGPIVGTTSMVASAGVATFANLFGTNVGTYTVGFTCGTLQGVTSTSVTVRHAAVAQLSIQTQPSATATAAVSFVTQPVIRLEDAFGNVATGANNQVSAGTATGIGILQGSTNAAMTNGIATFSGLNYTNAGAFTIRFAAPGLASHTSSAVNVVANFARTLVMTTQPSAVATAGVAWVTQALVRIEDGYGNLVSTGNISVGAATTGALIQGSTNTVSTNGLAAFAGQYLTNAGTFSLAFATPGFTGVTSSPITVLAAASARLGFVTPVPATVGACVAITPSTVVRLEDVFSNITTNSTNQVQAVLASGTGPLTGTTTTNAVGGMATFTNLVISATGTNYRIRFDSAGLASLTSSVFSVLAGVPAQLVLVTNISPVATAGVAFVSQPSLLVYDSCGNFVSTATNTVTAARLTGSGTLMGDTVRSAVGGVITFTNLFHTKTGTNAFTFTSPGLTDASSLVVTTRPSYASLLLVSQNSTTNPVAGQVFPTQAQVAVLDMWTNLVSTGNVTVTASTHAGPGILQGPATMVTTNGFGTFVGQFYTNAGIHQIKFEAAGFITAYSAVIAVQPAAAIGITLVNHPTNTGIDAAISPGPQVYLYDSYFNVASLSTALVTAAWSSGPGNLLGSTQALSVVGIATFTNLYFTNSGTYRIAYSAPTLGAVTSASIVATIGLAVQTQASVIATAGVTFARQPVVRIERSPGVVDTNATNFVMAATATGTGELQGVTGVRAVAGVATFTNLFYTNSGTFTLSFISTGLSSTVSSSLVVQAASANRLAVSVEPSAISTAGVAFVTQPIARIEDAFGNLVTTGSFAVAARNSAGPELALGGTTSMSTNGLAPFAGLYYTNAGSFSLLFTNAALSNAESAAFLVVPAAPARLVVSTEPAAQNHPCIALNPAPAARIEDIFGNTVSYSAAPLSVTLTSGVGPLGGTTNLNADSGLATFTNLSISVTGANYRIRFDSAGIASATSQVFGVFSLPYRLSLLTNVSAVATAGVRFARQPSLQILDACNNLVVDATNLVQASVFTGTNSFSGDTLRAPVNGVVTFTNLSLSVMGTNTLAFSATGLQFVESSVVTTRPSFASRLAVAQHPSTNATAGVAFATQPVIVITDDYYNQVTTGSVTITAVGYSTPAILRGPTTTSSVAGVANFSGLFFTNSGNHQIQFQATGFTSALSTAITVTPAAAARMVVGSQPTTVGIGTAMAPAPQIYFLDSFYNLANHNGATVNAARATGPGNVLGTTSVVSSAGIASFSNLILTNIGTYTVSFASAGFSTITSATITASVGLAIQTQPSVLVTAGVAFVQQPVVRIENSPGVVDTSATNLVQAATYNGVGVLFGTTSVRAVAGIATFSNLYYLSTGTHSIVFSSSNISSAVSSSMVVKAAAATRIVLAVLPSAVATAGVTFVTQPLARVEDNFGNLVTTGSFPITGSVLGNTAALQGAITTNSSGGLAQFAGLYLTNAGNHVLMFTNAQLQTSNLAPVTVLAAAPVRIGITVQPAAQAFPCVVFNPQPTAAIQDNYGNTSPTATNMLTVSAATGPGSLIGSLVVTAANGIAVFNNLSASATGTGYRLRFSASGYASVTSSVFSVTAQPYSFAIDTNVSTIATAGVRFASQPRLRVLDSCGNFLPSATNEVTAATQTGPGTLQGDTVVRAVNGYVTFTNLHYTQTGTHTVAFSSPGMTPVQSSSVDVRAGPATTLAMHRQPSATAIAGNAFVTQSIVKVTDNYGNLVTTGSFSLTSFTYTGPGILRGLLSATTSGGMATFSGQFYTNSGDFRIQYAAAGLSSAISSTVTVYAAAATSLYIYAQAATVPAGAPFYPDTVIAGLDRFNNHASLISATVTAAKVSGPGTLSGTLQAVGAGNGLATFSNLILPVSGICRLSFSSPGLGAVTSANITVASGEPYAVALLVQPSVVVTAGVEFVQQPKAVIVDQFGNIIPNATNLVFVSVYKGAGGVYGTTALTPGTNNIVEFTDLSLRTAGTNIALIFYAAGLYGGVSADITVLPYPQPAQIGAHVEASGVVTAGVAFAQQPVIRVEDIYGNFLSSGTYAVSARVRDSFGYPLPLFGNTNVTTASGLGSFTNLSLRTAGTSFFAWFASGLGVQPFYEYWPVEVMPGAATQLAVAGQPTVEEAGLTWGTIQIELRDAYGNLAHTTTGDVSVAVVSGPGAISGTLTTRSTNGLAEFSSISTTNAGDFILRYSAPGMGAVTGSVITVESGPAASMLILTQASAVAIGGVVFAQQPVIRVLDAFGNLLSHPLDQRSRRPSRQAPPTPRSAATPAPIFPPAMPSSPTSISTPTAPTKSASTAAASRPSPRPSSRSWSAQRAGSSSSPNPPRSSLRASSSCASRL